jgi:proteasome assembly chaperone 3
VPLDVSATDSDGPPSDLLPMHQLTATTILGGTVPELDILGQTLATNIASAIKTRNEHELRTVVLGTGLDRSMKGRAEFTELVGLVLDVL